jgi:hypothetical protein
VWPNVLVQGHSFRLTQGLPPSGTARDSKEHIVALERLRHRHLPWTTSSAPGRTAPRRPAWPRLLWLPLVAAAAILLPLGSTASVTSATPTVLTPAGAALLAHAVSSDPRSGQVFE